jgi:serine/threonine protein kinase
VYRDKRVLRYDWPPPHANRGRVPTLDTDTDGEDEPDPIDEVPKLAFSNAPWSHPYLRRLDSRHGKMRSNPPEGVDYLKIDEVNSYKWIPIKKLGQGGFGCVYLWIKVSKDEKTIVDKIAVKDADTRNHWEQESFWADDLHAVKGTIDKVSKEAAHHRRLTAKRRSPHIVKFRGERIHHKHTMTRMALDFAEFGDLYGLEDHFRKSAVPGAYMPTHFVYCLFLALVNACEKMEERDLIHRDLKVWTEHSFQQQTLLNCV